MIGELYGWFGKISKRKKLTEEDLRKIFRNCRRRYVVKHGEAPDTLVVREDEYGEWMGSMGITVQQVDKNLAPHHFMLALGGLSNQEEIDG